MANILSNLKGFFKRNPLGGVSLIVVIFLLFIGITSDLLEVTVKTAIYHYLLAGQKLRVTTHICPALQMETIGSEQTKQVETFSVESLWELKGLLL